MRLKKVKSVSGDVDFERAMNFLKLQGPTDPDFALRKYL